ncbi:MAG: TRAP transporter small permease [Clostridiales Family XIII bacterium]|nr:TRAP transporter small permease [Clostridiales Family XIII bacterium]
MNAFKKFNEKVGKVEVAITVCMMTVLVALVFFGALLRALRFPIVWSVDLAQLLFVWVCIFGADAAMKYKAHIGVDLLVKRIPVKAQNIIEMGMYIIIFCFLIFVIYQGTGLCMDNYLRKYQTLKISYSFGTAAIPLGSTFMLLTVAEQIGDLFKNWGKSSFTGESDETRNVS